MQRMRLRGGYRLLDLADTYGFLDRIARYQLSDQITIDVPLYRTANRWDRDDVLNYDKPTVSALADAINLIPEPVTFIDCGADIGVMSILVAVQSANIEQFIGIEPNAAAYEIFKRNYERLPFQSKAIHGASATLMVWVNWPALIIILMMTTQNIWFHRKVEKYLSIQLIIWVLKLVGMLR